MSAHTQPPASTVQILATLDADWKEQVEDLLYFNPKQAALKDRILESIQLYGVPRIEATGGNVRITLDGRVEPGSLFALVKHDEAESVLAGLILYLRRETGLICLYMSVSGDYTARGPHACHGVALRLLDAVQHVGLRIRGVDHIEVYNRACWYKIPLARSII
jgi:hypothetical protein